MNDRSRNFLTKLRRNAESKRMQRIRQSFDSLLNDENIDAIRVFPKSGAYRNVEVTINTCDIEGVYAYKHNVAVLKVFKNLGNKFKGSSIGDYIFITATEGYMHFLFDGIRHESKSVGKRAKKDFLLQNSFTISAVDTVDTEDHMNLEEEQLKWCDGWIQGVLYEQRYGRSHPIPLGPFPK